MTDFASISQFFKPHKKQLHDWPPFKAADDNKYLVRDGLTIKNLKNPPISCTGK